MDYSKFEEHRKNRGTIANVLIEQPQFTLGKAPKRLSGVKALSNSIYRVHGDDKPNRLDLVPSELDLAFVVKNPAQTEFKLENALGPIRSKYDYIIVDCAPTDSVLTTIALTASDFILVPMRPDRFSILGFYNLRNTVSRFRNDWPDPHKVQELGVVFTQVQGRSSVESECMNSIRLQALAAKSYVFESTIKYSQSFLRGAQDQTPVFETLYVREPLKKKIANLVKEMKQRINSLSSNSTGT
jgi:chromosome partitioning protein